MNEEAIRFPWEIVTRVEFKGMEMITTFRSGSILKGTAPDQETHKRFVNEACEACLEHGFELILEEETDEF